ncbi:MAG: hypothetical protein ACR2QE_12025 [Acidimicrobiales bacterium]
MRRWSSVVVAITLLAAACGSEDASTPTSSSAAPTSSETSTTSTEPGATTPTTIALVEVDPDDQRVTVDTTAPNLGSTSTTTAQPETTVAEVTGTTLAPSEAPTIEAIGPGRPQWFSTDNSTLVVANVRDSGGPVSCDGLPRPSLDRLPLDDSEPTVAVLGTSPEALGQLARPDFDVAALLDGCGGEVTTLWVGNEAPNGLMARMQPVALDRSVSVVGEFTTRAEGTAFVGSTVGQGSTEPMVIEIDARSGVVTNLFPGEYLRVAAVADGTYLGLTWGGELRHLESDGTLLDSTTATAFALAADRSTAAVFTESTVELGPAGGAPTAVIPLPAAGPEQGRWSAVVLPDGDGVVFTRQSAVDQPIWWATGTGELVELVAADQWSELVLNGDGQSVATSRPLADTADPFAEEAVVITR